MILPVLHMEVCMEDREKKVRRFLVHVCENIPDGALMPRPPYIVCVGADIMEQIAAKRFGIERYIYYVTDEVLAAMHQLLMSRGVEFLTDRDSGEKTLSLFLRKIGLPPWKKLNDMFAVTELKDQDESEGTIIEVPSEIEPIICSGSAPLIPRYHI